MEGFKEFTGKSLDDAIREACSYYDATRERLEIDIVQDAKSGIFGLVGARKAMVRARRVQLRDTVEDILGRSKKATAAAQAASPKDKKTVEASPAKPKPSEEVKEEAQVAPAPAPVAQEERKKPAKAHDKSSERGANNRRERQPKPRKEHGRRNDGSDNEANGNRVEPDGNRVEPDGNRVEPNGNRADARDRHDRQPRQSRDNRHKEHRDHKEHRRQNPKRPAQPKPAPTEHMDNMGFGDDMEEADNVRRVPLEELDQERLKTVTLEAVGILTRAIVGEVPLEMKLHEGRVHVHLDCEENSGLLIGREGQTLASLQYITSRIVSRAMDAAVRVQLDAGDYRTRQDEKLSELASVLAERVRATGKAHSTRPLSSYHRRIVHVVLQDATDLVTRSSGDGPLKRVIIQRKRG